MSRTEKIIFLLLFCWAALVLFWNLGELSVEIYDEGRRAVSASEMAAGRSHPLVPTYNGHPDHWGTKPPLLVLCQAVWMRLVGVNEWALRLPSALATLALCGLLAWWGHRDWRHWLVGGFAAVVLLCNWEFVGNHGARSGDFDALLMLFLTAQLIFFYRWVTSGEGRWLWLAGAAVVLAGLTKGIAGGFFLPGIGLWLLLSARRHLLRRELYGVIGGALGLVAGYYLLRDAIDPGYLDLVRANELGGRFVETNEGHAQPWWYYPYRLATDRSFRWVLPLLVPALWVSFGRKSGGAAGAKGGSRSGVSPAALVAVTAVVFLVVISVSATKLYWYKNPVLPLLGLLIGNFLCWLGQSVADRWGRAAAAALLTLLLIVPAALVTGKVADPADYQETPPRKLGYRMFLRNPEVTPPFTVLVHEYRPNAQFYVNQRVARGEDVRLRITDTLAAPLQLSAPPPGGLAVGERVVVCRTETWRYVAERFESEILVQEDPCKLLRLWREK